MLEDGWFGLFFLSGQTIAMPSVLQMIHLMLHPTTWRLCALGTKPENRTQTINLYWSTNTLGSLRMRWSMAFFGLSSWTCSLFKLTVFMCHMLRQKQFITMSGTQRRWSNLDLMWFTCRLDMGSNYKQLVCLRQTLEMVRYVIRTRAIHSQAFEELFHDYRILRGIRALY